MPQGKYCYNCRFYKAYFTKGYKQFDKCDIGLCLKKKLTMGKSDFCENYSCAYYGRIDRKQAALAAVIDNINVLAELKQILEEDDEEAIDELFYNFKNRKK